jgi:hypothetical protein
VTVTINETKDDDVDVDENNNKKTKTKKTTTTLDLATLNDDDGLSNCNVVVVGYQTSPQVSRYRCSTCYTPLFATLGGGGGGGNKMKKGGMKKNKMMKIAIPQLVLFPNSNNIPSEYQPTHHMYYASRYPRRLIDKLFLDDGLPKFVGTSAPHRGIKWTNENDEKSSEESNSRNKSGSSP